MDASEVHKDPGYNFGHSPKNHVNPESYARISLPYKAISRIINVIEDLHFQMQKPQDQRFIDYPIEQFEEVDTFIRDNMSNLALSLEMRALAEQDSKND